MSYTRSSVQASHGKQPVKVQSLGRGEAVNIDCINEKA